MADEEDAPRQEEERRWNEAQKRYLEYFKQMTVLNTASMGVLVTLSGQSGQIFLMIPLLGIAFSLLGFAFSLLTSMVGMFFVVEASYFRVRVEHQQRLARAAHGVSAMTFVVGLLVAVTAAMYAQLGAPFWLWAGLLTLYIAMLVFLLTRFRSSIVALRESWLVITDLFAAASGVFWAAFTAALEGFWATLVAILDSLITLFSDLVTLLVTLLVTFFSNLTARAARFLQRFKRR